MARSRLPIGLFALLAILAATAWLIRPWFHGVVMLFYAYPAVTEAIVLGVLGLVAFVTVASSGQLEWLARTLFDSGGNGDIRVDVGAVDRRAATSAAVLGLTILVVVAPLVLGGAFAQEHVAHNLAVQDVDSLPEIDDDRPRVLPKSVARQYAENSLQYPRYRLTEADIAMRDGSPAWAFGLAPDGGINNLLLVGKGAAFVDMTTQSKRVEIAEFDQRVGFGFGLAGGEGIVSKYRWRLLKEEFLVRYTDPVMLDHEDGLYMAVPYVSYEHHVRLLPFPTMYTTPHWGGVALVAPDGSTTHLSPAEARQHPVLQGQRLFPFELAKYYVEAQRYQHGILNKWFVHEDELEVAPVPGAENEQPFLAVTERGIQYFVAAEPYGDAQGIYQIWMFDARRGTAERYQLPVDSALMGPRRAADFVRKANDRTDWDRFSPAEPVPAVINETLYWQVRVVPSDSSGIAFTAFVDAESGDVYTFSTDERIREFLAGSVAEDRTDEPETSEAAIVITIRDANGEVVNTVTVERGQSVEIAYQNATGNASTTG